MVNGGLLPAGVFQAIHFGVMNHASFLDALVVAAADDLPIANQHRANRYAADRQPFSSLFDRCFEKLIHAIIQTFRLTNDKLDEVCIAPEDAAKPEQCRLRSPS